MNAHRRSFLLLSGAVVAAAILGWVAGSQVSSPADIAANTAPPQASPILVPAEERVLSSDIVSRGTARFGSPQQLFIASSTLKSDAGVAARLPVTGAELEEGSLVLTKSGRPIFLLSGTLPVSRDIGPGSSGDDVMQVEEALARLGFDPGPVDGTYDDKTASAVGAWYAESGFTPFEASQAELDAIRTLSSDSNAAQSDLIVARESVTTAEAALAGAIATRDRALQAEIDTAAAIETVEETAAARNAAANADVDAKRLLLQRLSDEDFVPPESIAAARTDFAAAKAVAEVTR